MTDAEITFNFAKFRIKRLAHKASTYLRLRDHFAAGGTVVETFAGDREWSAKDLLPSGSFVRDFYTPEKIAAHLTARHCGFNTELRFV